MSTPLRVFNPRFVLYCVALNTTPDKALDDDDDGALIRGYVRWNLDRIREYMRAHPENVFGTREIEKSICNFNLYDAWLVEWVERERRQS